MSAKLRIVSVALLACACSDIMITKVKDDAKEEGLRFWRPSPYLVVSSNDGQCVTQITWLPDPDGQFRAEPRSGLFGSVSFKPSLQDGWMLTGFDSSSESKLSDLVGALTGFVSGGGASAKAAALPEKTGGPPGKKAFPLGVYRMNLKGDCDPRAPGATNPGKAACLEPFFIPNAEEGCSDYGGLKPASSGTSGGDSQGQTGKRR